MSLVRSLTDPLSRWMRWCLGAWALFTLCLGLAHADTGALAPVPALTARVMDQTATLNTAQHQTLESQLTALEQARELVGSHTVIVSLQNGVGNEPRITAAFPHNTVLGGAICAYLEFAAPGEVVWTDDRGGLADGGARAGVCHGEVERERAAEAGCAAQRGGTAGWGRGFCLSSPRPGALWRG